MKWMSQIWQPRFIYCTTQHAWHGACMAQRIDSTHLHTTQHAYHHSALTAHNTDTHSMDTYSTAAHLWRGQRTAFVFGGNQEHRVPYSMSLCLQQCFLYHHGFIECLHSRIFQHDHRWKLLKCVCLWGQIRARARRKETSSEGGHGRRRMRNDGLKE